jgi:endonuclease/exonuclease/phosphatase family metal-dependent hydrolase
VHVLTWNLFHGRDYPPDPALRTIRSRLTHHRERNQSHVHLNRDLFEEFARTLAKAKWDVALLQECPPRWAPKLVGLCGASGHRVLTSRNWLLPITSRLAARNPELLASWEGGSNLTLVRGGPVSKLGSVTLRRLPERRAMGLIRRRDGLCVANLHLSENDRRAAEEAIAAAENAVSWAGDAPLIVGGDFNLRPSQHPEAFAELERRFGLRGATGPNAIDHLLARGLRPDEPPRAWPDEARELIVEGLRLRLSDHAPVGATFSPAKAGRESRGPSSMVR